MYWPSVSEEKKFEMQQLRDPSLRQSVLKLKSSIASRGSSQAYSQRPEQPQTDWKARASLDRVLLHQNAKINEEALPAGRNSNLSRRY